MEPSKLRDAFRACLPDIVTDLRALAADRCPDATGLREAGYRITNQADKSTIRIYDEIWWLGVNAEDFTTDLENITSAEIEVQINSPGGGVFDGIAIYNSLRNHPATVTTRVDALAASIASVIVQAGDRRVMQPAAQMMIHNAHGLVVGDNRVHQDMADLLRQQDSVIAGIYASRSGRDADAFRELMNAETWLTAERAVAEGLADEVVDATTPANVQRPELYAQIADTVRAVDEAVKRADEVRALRSEAGKDLSQVVTASLLGLRESMTRLDDLLALPTPDDGTDRWDDAELERYMARLDAYTV